VQNDARWWVPISIQRLFGADGEDDGANDSSQEDSDSDDSDDDSDDGETTFDKSYVDKLRKEAADRRIKTKEANDRAAAAEAELAKIKQAEMNELEKAQAAAEAAAKKSTEAEARAAQAEAALRQNSIQTAVALAAANAGFQDPSDALSMISQDDLLDEEGAVSDKAVTSKLKALAKAKPYLLKKRSGGSGDGGPKGNPSDADSFEAKQKAYLDEFTTTGGRVPAA
jgi:multidrug efflux pump subunit AcrA (membrane-fusion protein)